jgi:hypothetical protein
MHAQKYNGDLWKKLLDRAGQLDAIYIGHRNIQYDRLWPETGTRTHDLVKRIPAIGKSSQYLELIAEYTHQSIRQDTVIVH